MSDIKEASFDEANMAFQLGILLACLGEIADDDASRQFTYVELENLVRNHLGDMWQRDENLYIDQVTLGHALQEFWNCLRSAPFTMGDSRRTPGFGWKKVEDKTKNAVIVPAAEDGSGMRQQSVGYKYTPRTEGTTAQHRSGRGSNATDDDAPSVKDKIHQITEQLLKSKKLSLPQGVFSLSALYSPKRVQQMRHANF